MFFKHTDKIASESLYVPAESCDGTKGSGIGKTEVSDSIGPVHRLQFKYGHKQEILTNL